MSREYGQHQSQEPLVWDRVEWRQGDGRYTFQLASGGLLATLTAPHGGKLTLPMVAWEGLLDALAAQRKTRNRAESKFPARAGARWYDGETGELAAAFKAGRTVRQLARAHNRTELAVEAELERQGLWDRIERRPKHAGDIDPRMEGGQEAGTAPAPAPIPFPSDRD